MIDDEVTPVFLINGFLEAGKTEFLSFTMDQDYFRTDGKTILIVCEEGDTEYDDALLAGKAIRSIRSKKSRLGKRTQIREEAFPCQTPENGGKIKRE